ncbi:hypothetical protein [Pseudomonas asiatica]
MPDQAVDEKIKRFARLGAHGCSVSGHSIDVEIPKSFEIFAYD